MCRIVGVYQNNYNGQYDLSDVGNEMRDTMILGGPDSAGNHIDSDHGLYLGHRRLSIIDLSELGHQPMSFEQYEIAFNGEIYNYQDIKKELESLGHQFKSNSDTEVVLKSFIQWGKSCVEKFHGMWAFAIWDRENKRLTLCRDRMGVKPLFYYLKDNTLLFSSELKAFHKFPGFDKTLDDLSVSLFLQRGYIQAPKSIFKFAKKVKPGTFVEVDSDLNITETKYWDINKIFSLEKWNESEDELRERLEDELQKAFKHRMVADVPVGVFLSGGVDSSTVAALLQKDSPQQLKTFTIGFEDQKFNEAEFAKEISNHLGTEHHEYYCTTKDAQEIIPKLPELYDEPFGDSSAIPTYLVSKFAVDQVKVALSADGGDEQMFGYNRYKMYPGLLSSKYKAVGALVNTPMKVAESVLRSTPKGVNALTKLTKLRYIQNASNKMEGFDRFVNEYFPSELKYLGLKNHMHQSELLADCTHDISVDDQMMLYDQQTYMIDDILQKVDRATMSVSLEGREPFLDHKLIEFTSRIPVDLKYKNGKDKYLLREVLYKHVPKEMIERPKMGFGIPLKDWFQGDLKSFYTHYMNEDYLRKDGTFDAKRMSQLSEWFLEDRLDKYDYKMWFVFSFLQWKDYWKID